MSRWNQKAIQAQAGHDQLILLSQNFDRSKLLKGAWSTLSSKLDERRLAREWEAKEVFYTSLEQTAVRERDSNLKWIAFSHWKVFAKENKERTSVARRHIMRKRYFQAWTNITALTDLKVRRFVLARFFRRWHDRAQQLRTGAEMATLRYETNLTKRMYLAWYWAFAERTAPEFHDRKLESKFFYLWRGRFNEVLDQDAQAEEHCAQSAEKSVFLPWVSKARELLDMSRAAEEFRKQRLLEPILKIWKKEAILAPRVAQVALRVDTRTRNDIFNKWHINTMQSRQATETDRQRVLRNAFTAWNDRVRTNFLQGQIDIRFKSEALYKWRLASRSNAAQLEHDRRLAHSALFHWLSKAQNRHRSIEGAEQTLEASQQRRTLQSAFSKLLSARQHQQDLETEADNFRASRLVYGALAKWRQKSADVALLYRKADAAEFFILTTKSLKRWSHSTKEHQKYRKREAYSQIRRLCKMNMAREKLSRMQIQLAHVRNMEHCALEFQEDSAIKSTISTFRFWKHKAVAILAQERQAEKHYNEKLQAAALQKLVMRKNQMQEMTAQARELSAESAGVEAMNCLRRLDRRLFQIKGQEQWAKALREKHAEKHVKNMLRYWHEQTMASQRQRDAPRLDEDIFRASTTTAPALDDLTVFDHTAWNLESLELNLDTFANTAQGDVDATFMDDGIMTSTPMPGYLRTPSKRNTARAKARERLAANAPATITRTIRFADQVPATAPPRQQTISAPPVLQSPGPSITPFERKLREQGIASPSRTPKGTPGRRGGSSRFGNSVGAGRFGASMSGRGAFAGFEDIPEVSEDRSRGF
jgi:protein SFI1